MKRVSLGIPLMISLVGTLASLPIGSEKAHIAFGAAITGLSLVHAYQYRKAMMAPIKRKMVNVPHPSLPHPDMPHPTLPDKLKREKRGGDIAFYMPGRIRVYAKAGQGEKALTWLAPLCHIGDVQINETTGSVLITYDPAVAAADKALKKITSYAQKHAALAF